ncbi:MAG: hypothetical protein QOG71_3509 [Pyrinomonadaceae bacterium]|nr:hypothetical protein [Pyrinomonadaceae bacterium]
MSNENFWKDQYQQSWEKANLRERRIIERIKEETGRDTLTVGLGAGSTEYLAGSAASRGLERGGADLHVSGSNIFLEVTGPQTKAVKFDAPLWIRPDKIQNARRHYPEHDTWVIHWLEKDGTLRVIQLNQEFFSALDNGEFPIVHPRIRGNIETYHEISHVHWCVKEWQYLIDHIKQL